MVLAEIEAKYKELILELLPQGKAWDKTEGSNTNLVMGAISKEFARIHELAEGLPKELNPLYTQNFLDEWEDALGTQLDCNEIDDTFEARKNAVIAKLRSVGGSSIGYYETVAKTLGYPVTITDKFGQFKVGRDAVGEPLAGDDWRTVFQVRGPEQTTRYFKVGSSKVGEPLANFGADLLECIINRIKTAGKIALFVYYTITHNANANLEALITASAIMNQKRFAGADLDILFTAGIYDLWLPSELEKAVLWLDAKDFTGAAAISSWTNKSNSVFDLDAVQDTGANQPDSVLAAMNNLPVARFAQGDSLEIKYNADLDLATNLDIFIMGSFTNAGSVMNRGQFDLKLGSTLESTAQTKSWHVRQFGVEAQNYLDNNFLCRFNGDLIVGLDLGLYKSSDEGETWIEIFKPGGVDQVPCRGINGGFLIFNDKLYITSSTVREVYEYTSGTTVVVYDLTSVFDAGSYTWALAEYDGYLYCSGGSDPSIAKLDGTWSKVADCGVGASYARGMAADDNYLYVAITGSNDIWKWDGTTFTAMSTGIVNPILVFVAQGTVWCVNGVGTIYNAANSWASGLTTSVFSASHYALTPDGNSVFISGSTPVRYDFNGTALDAENLKGFYENTGLYQIFYDELYNQILAVNASNRNLYRITQNALITESSGVPSSALFHFTFYDTYMQMRINGELVAEILFGVFYDTESGNEEYRRERILQEIIDVTSGLVTVVDNIVTINPTADLSENSTIEIAVDDGAITDWQGVDDWYFETGES